MATETIDYQSPTYLPVVPCQLVEVCLTTEWESLTVDGSATAFATVENAGRFLGPSVLPGLFGLAGNPRGENVYQYALTFDLTQFLADNVPTCDDILGINPFSCGAAQGSDTGPDEAERLAYFGPGTDGNATNPATATSDKYYDNLTVALGQTFNTAGYTIRVKGTATILGTIEAVGVAGNAAVVGAGGTGAAGQDGAAGGTGVGAQPTNVTPITPTNGGNGGAGGAGGAGTSGAGGAARTTVVSPMNDPQNLLVTPVSHAGEPSQAGSSGAGDGTEVGGGGGEGATGGPPINVYTRFLSMGAAGKIRSIGGAGGAGGNSAAGNTGGGGGAGGAGGGPVTLVYESGTFTAGAQVRSTGGAAGALGTKTGTGVNGSAGAAGGSGLVQRFNLTTGVVGGTL